MQNSKEDMKELIIDCARDHFARFGFKKTTMDEIAQSVYRGKTSIYHYFKGKDQIFSEVVEKESKTMIAKIKEAVNQERTPQKKLQKFLVSRLRNLEELPNLYSALKDEGIEHHLFVLDLRQKHNERELKIVSEILKEGTAQGIFRDKTKFEIILKGVMVAFSGLESLWDENRKVVDNEKDVDEIMDLVFHGILKK